jgi:LPS-assembly lipoprotein
MSKGRIHRGLALIGLLVLLAGCGFHLRGYNQTTPNLDGLFVDASERRDSLAGEIRLQLAGVGARLAATSAEARHLLRISGEQFSQRVMSVDANGKVLEFELRLQAVFEVQGAGNVEVLPQQPMELTRQVSSTGADELGQRNEAELLRGDMRRDMASQIIRALQAQLK